MNKTNEREKRFAAYILEALQELHEAAEDANAVATHRSLIAAIIENLNEYRAEEREELVAAARDAIEMLELGISNIGAIPPSPGFAECDRILLKSARDALAALVGVRR